MTFGVVILSILLHGLTMAGLLRRLRLIDDKQDRLAYEVYRATLRGTQAALHALDRFEREKHACDRVIMALRERYRQELEAAQAGMRDHHLEQRQLEEEERHSVERQLLAVEKEQLLDSLREGLIGRNAFESLMGELDARLLSLEAAADSVEDASESTRAHDATD